LLGQYRQKKHSCRRVWREQQYRPFNQDDPSENLDRQRGMTLMMRL
jgi:hypothetical protein